MANTLSAGKKVRKNSNSEIEYQEALFAGPLPHPSIMQEYESIVPGAAQRLLNMAEKQQEHRMRMETKLVSTGVRRIIFGQIFGFIIGFIGTAGSLYLVYLGHDTAGAAIGSTSLVALVSIFVLGKRNSNNEKPKK